MAIIRLQIGFNRSYSVSCPRTTEARVLVNLMLRQPALLLSLKLPFLGKCVCRVEKKKHMYSPLPKFLFELLVL